MLCLKYRGMTMDAKSLGFLTRNVLPSSDQDPIWGSQVDIISNVSKREERREKREERREKREDEFEICGCIFNFINNRNQFDK